MVNTMLERVWIDSCNICYIDTANHEDFPICTKVWCGEQFDRFYHEDELVFTDGLVHIK